MKRSPMRRRPTRRKSTDDPQLLAEFRTAGWCEGGCRVWCRRREPHHVVSKGCGGPDHRLNLLALGTAFDCHCHSDFQQYRRSIEEAQELVAWRESVPVTEVNAVVREIMRAALNKEPK
jgi:hypothetical protein